MRNRLTITKTTTALATSALLVLGLAACGGSGDDTSTDSETTTSAEESSDTADESSDAADETTDDETAEDTAEGDGAAPSGDVCDTIDKLTDVGSVDTSDMDATAQAFEDISSSFEGAEPPAEIADDWGTLTTSFRTFSDAFSTAAADPANADTGALTDAVSGLTSSEFTSATQNVAMYGAQNC